MKMPVAYSKSRIFIAFFVQECELDKKTGEMKISRKTVFQKLFPQYTDHKIGRLFLLYCVWFNIVSKVKTDD